MDPREEQELRDLIRKELENRDRLRGEQLAERTKHAAEHWSAERQRVIEDEIAAFYRAKGGYQRHVSDDGDVEWLTAAELDERGKQIPVDMEELEVGQRRVRNRLVAFIVLAIVAVVLLFVLLRDRSGSVEVICNVPATIYLNGSSTEFQTDNRLTHLPVGPHIISVGRSGYLPDGAGSARVDLRAGQTEIVVFKLKPMETDSGRGSQQD